MMKTVAAANRRPPSPAILDRTFSLPGFWDGAAHARETCGDMAGALAARRIKSALLAGAALRDIPEFRAWEQMRAR